MNTKTLSPQALSVIDHYRNFSMGSAQCSIPYFNNKRTGTRGGLRAEIGKGSPQEIAEEIELKTLEQKIRVQDFTPESLKHFLVDTNIGIDCSGFAYYILQEEGKARGKGTLDRRLSFPFAQGILGSFKAKMRPVENTDVKTFAHASNSGTVPLRQVEVGDIITLIGGPDDGERDHILIIHQIEYQNFNPTILHYVHSIAWPTDGEYGHGIHEGKIEIVSLEKSITEQTWIENEKTGHENYTLSRALKSTTELRRLRGW